MTDRVITIIPDDETSAEEASRIVYELAALSTLLRDSTLVLLIERAREWRRKHEGQD